MRFRTEQIKELPRLGWVALVHLDRPLVRVVHGDSVEVGEDFVVEGCWSGPFDALQFDRSRCFFGSALRVLGERVLAVPSCSLTDRLVLAELDDLIVISNSLVLLLATLGARLDPDVDMRAVCHAVISGVNSYRRDIPVRSPFPVRIEQCFHRVECIEDGKRWTQAPLAPMVFNEFSDYEESLQNVLAQLCANTNSSSRKTKVAHWCTTSSGYDSSAVSALAAGNGVRKTFATDGGRSFAGTVLEDARGVADALALEVTALRPRAPSREMELQLLAATFDGRESMFVAMLEQLSTQREVTCLWTGYHGDKVWDRATQGLFLDDAIRRGDTSGFNLTEARLHYGFFNMAVPFMFASSVRYLVQLANSTEMAPWQIGGAYDRPIPRRLAEQRGVPRCLFGQTKQLVMEYYTYPRNRQLRAGFLQHLSARGFGPVSRALYHVAEIADYRLAGSAFMRRAPGRPASFRELLHTGPYGLANELYCWAVNVACDGVAAPLQCVLGDTAQPR